MLSPMSSASSARRWGSWVFGSCVTITSTESNPPWRCAGTHRGAAAGRTAPSTKATLVSPVGTCPNSPVYLTHLRGSVIVGGGYPLARDGPRLVGRGRTMNLADLVRDAGRADPERTAVLFRGRPMTFAQLDQ